MKFSASKKDLLSAISPVMRAIDSRTTLPVLGNILLDVQKNILRLTTTNLEITVQVECPVVSEKEGSVTIPAKIFSSYISLVTGDKMDFELTENLSLQITAGGSKTEIKGISADEFPVIPEMDSQNELSLAAPVLAKAMDQVIFAASTDPTRPVLSAILFLIQKDNFKIVATNSYRLAERVLPLLEKQKSEIKILIPSRAAAELSALLSKEAETVRIKISENQASFEVAHIKFTTRLVDGKFPDYEQIIPSESKTEIRVPTEDFITSLRRAGLFADQISGKIRLSSKNNQLIIVADTGQIGHDEIILPATIKGGDVEIALNTNYLIDMLGHASAAETEISLIDAIKPAVIRPVKEKNYTYVVMPLKLD